MYKVGAVTIIGRANVGKSTLLNNLLKEKLAIVSDKVGTTRNAIYGIYNDEDSQIIFIDTPGINRSFDQLGRKMNKTIVEKLEESEIILFLVDAKKGLTPEDKKILKRIEKSKNVFLLINKIDGLSKEEIMDAILKYKDIYPFKEIVPISGRRGDNVDSLIKTIKKYLVESDQKFYDEERLTFNTTEFLISEIVREKVLNKTYEEVPHEITCITRKIEEDKKIINAYVDIIVSRDNLKSIIIGKRGKMIKEIGTLSRIELEELFKKKVYLELKVKTVKDWKNKDQSLKELGF